ncbi:hypothetical protein D3C85_1562320 [compost metagenome]
MIPTLVVTLFPAAVRYDDHRNVEGADGAVECAQVVEQADLRGDGFDKRIDFTAFGEEIVVRIDQQIGGSAEGIECF